MNRFAVCLVLLIAAVSAKAAEVELVVVYGAIQVSSPAFGMKDLAVSAVEFVPLDEKLTISAVGQSSFSINDFKGRPKVWLLDSGDSISYQDIVNPTSPTFWKRVSLVLEKAFIHESGTKQGAERFDDQTREAGFPAGTILRPEADLIFIPDSQGGSYNDFMVFEANSKTLLTGGNQSNGGFHVPAGMLEYERSYDWTVRKNGKLIAGTFSVANREDQAAFESELRTIPHYDAFSAQEKLLVKAIKAKEWDFTFDMDSAARQLLATQGK